MKPETFLERIELKPQKKLNNSDVQTILLHDIKLELERTNILLAGLTPGVKASGSPADGKKWWKKIFS